MAKRYLDDLIAIDSELMSFQSCRHEQCDQCGDLVELRSVVLVNCGFVCSECLSNACLDRQIRDSPPQTHVVNQEEHRKQVFRAIREAQLGVFFDLNQTPRTSGFAGWELTKDDTTSNHQSSSSAISFKGAIATSNLIFNPQNR